VNDKHLDAFSLIYKGAVGSTALVPQQQISNAVRTSTPTEQVYGVLQAGYTHLNDALFNSKLPNCLITLQRDRGAYGYFAAGSITAIGRVAVCDEIALNPRHFAVRTARETFSTLTHEMAHCEQAHFGTPSPHGYHNRQWVEMMRRVGLEPSSTGKPGGKPTGRAVSHFIIPDGPFDLALKAFEATGLTIGWGDVPAPVGAAAGAAVPSPAKRKREDFDCPHGCGTTVQATSKTEVDCHRCKVQLVIRLRG
jgi:hypothetical protein